MFNIHFRVSNRLGLIYLVHYFQQDEASSSEVVVNNHQLFKSTNRADDELGIDVIDKRRCQIVVDRSHEGFRITCERF